MPYDKKTGDWKTREARAQEKALRREENRRLNMDRQKVVRAMRCTPEGKKERQMALLERLLSDDNMTAVMTKVMAIISNDEHPAQGQMLKMCMDRMLPVSMFEDKANRGHSQIQINITGLDSEVKGETIEND